MSTERYVQECSEQHYSIYWKLEIMYISMDSRVINKLWSI